MVHKSHLYTLTLLIISIFLLAACGATEEAPAPEQLPAEELSADDSSAEQPSSQESSTGDVQVALLLPGPITDGGWDQLAYEGLEELKVQDGFDGSFTENIGQADIAEITRGYADDGYDLMLGHGFEFGSAFLEIAPDYPDQQFFATTFQPQDDIPSNVQYVDAAYYDAAYSAGALAALISENGIVGFVGGGDNPTQRGMMNAFIYGAESTVPGTIGLGVVTGDYNDAAKGRESAVTMIGNGADVIWHAADVTGLGAIEGAVASDALVLGAYSDQTGIAPDNMGASLVMDLNAMVQKLGHDVRDGTFNAGQEWRPTVSEMWHWSAGDGDHNSAIISDDVWEEYLQIWNDLDAGNIDYPIVTDGVAPAPEAAEPMENVQVALLLPGPITDGGWDQLAYEGLEELKVQDGFDGSFTENIGQADIAEITRGYADDGYDLMLGHGFEFGSAFLEIAPDYPDQQFFATTFQPQDDIPSNVQYVDAAYYDAAYSAGALAALISENGIVGFVGGGDNPTQRGMMNAFIYGAENTVPGTIGLGVVTGDYNDAAKGRESAVTMIGNGADVIWHAADVTGLGAIEGAVASDALVLGAYSDQTGIAPDNMGASLVMDLNAMVQKLAHDVRDGTFTAGQEWQPSISEMWHWSAGDGDHNSAIIADDVWEEYLQIWNDLDAGNIDYPIETD